jgi:hypothetical protein
LSDIPRIQLLLLLWKTLLSCCGGIRELARVKKLARELGGLPPVQDEGVYGPRGTAGAIAYTGAALPIKSTPLDIEMFRQETVVKYPTFTPPPAQLAPTSEPQLRLQGTASKASPVPLITSRLAQAYSPIRIRHHYHHDNNGSSSQPGVHGHNSHSYPFQTNQQQQQQPYRVAPQPLTPAPSPPPSPKLKKQQYQTDQNRPFLFPFSKAQSHIHDYVNARLVPFAIDEADKLYNKHMYISLALAQMWRTREDCMTEESGLECMPGDEGGVIRVPSSSPVVSVSAIDFFR